MKEQFLKTFASMVSQYDPFLIFLFGILCGMVLLVLLLLLIGLLHLIFRYKRNISGVQIQAENGNVFIASRTISDLVRLQSKNFPELDISHVYLRRVRKELILLVKANYINQGKNIPDTVNSFQNAILENLKNTLGIDSIKKVNLLILRGKL